MSKNIKTVVYIELECDVDADVFPGEKGMPQTMDGPGTPDIGPDVSINSVEFRGVDIVHLLKRKELRGIEEDVLAELEKKS